MALTFKDTESKKTVAKRTVKITNVHINNGIFEDEEGNIANRLEEVLIPDLDAFDIAIKFELPEEEDSEDVAYGEEDTGESEYPF